MKIILYTVTDCKFSKEEKDYLASHALLFEEKNLETNRDFLTEMLTLSNNFAGTPVTKIEKDDGQIVILKGFTQSEFDATLGFTPPPQNQSVQNTAPATDHPVSQPIPPPVPQPVNPAPVPEAPMPVPPPPPVAPVQQPAPLPPAPVPVQTPQAPTQQANPMNTVLNNLQEQVASAPPLPNIPDPKL